MSTATPEPVFRLPTLTTRLMGLGIMLMPFLLMFTVVYFLPQPHRFLIILKCFFQLFQKLCRCLAIGRFD